MEGDTNIIDIQPNVGELNLCMSSNCIQDNDQYKLECAECHHLVHYNCTQLPVFQLQLFLTKGYRKFICVNCVDIPEYLNDMFPNKHPLEQSHSKTMMELTAALKLTAEENERVKVKCDQLRSELEKLTEESKRYVEELTQFQSDISVYENSVSLFEDNEARLKSIIASQQTEVDKQNNAVQSSKEEIDRLQSDIDGYENSIKSYEENELNLKTMNANQKNDLKELEEKFNEVGNPDFDMLVKLEESMKKKLDSIGQALKESLSNEVQVNNKQIEMNLDKLITTRLSENSKGVEKIETKINEALDKNKTYAESLTKNLAITNLTSVIESTKNDDLVQEKERERRATNLIIYGINEVTDNDLKEHDEQFVASFLDTIGIAMRPQQITRLGKTNEDKKRPVKLVMDSVDDKEQIMARLSNLKNAEEVYRTLSIREDYTIKERELIREWVSKAEQKNKEENTHNWKVRGTPKNGLRLVRITKR
jgi:hypothetical protein